MLLQWTAASGKSIYKYVCPIVANFCLEFATGSTFWEEQWIAHEANITNKKYLREYLGTGEIDLLIYLQKSLTGCYKKYTTKWEHLRLLAVLEKANNGSPFARALLLEVADPALLIKVGLGRSMEELRKKINQLTTWRESYLHQEEVDIEQQECMPKKYTSSSK